MESHAATARRIHLAFAAAGLIAATVLAVTVKVGLDMASYLETTALTNEDFNAGSTPGSRRAAPQVPATAVDPAIAAVPASTLETRNEDAVDPRFPDRTVAAAP